MAFIFFRFSAVTMSFCLIRFSFWLDVLGVSLEEYFLFPCHVAFPTHLVVIFCLISWCAHMSIRLLLHRLISFAISFFSVSGRSSSSCPIPFCLYASCYSFFYNARLGPLPHSSSLVVYADDRREHHQRHATYSIKKDA